MDVNSKIVVSGNIISELSEKIPTNIIALNELIKNSYDAGASKVSIFIDTSSKTLVVSDDGDGMNKSDIDTLFHISKSTKTYGEINKHGRYTQGSKGLGFLSVFKFGNYVSWETKTDAETGLKFTIDYNELITSNDISQFEIEITEDTTVAKGTSIIITLDEYNSDTLEKYFSIEKNYKKILNAFDDNSFIIELQINELKYSSLDAIPLKDNSKNDQLYHITYDSNDQLINFFYNDCKILEEKYLFDSQVYKLKIDLLIFQFLPYGKKKVDEFFLNPQDDLTPLLYVNSNLFSNYDLFDPNVMKNIKTSQVLNQMIGYIKIISTNSLINFNSDRSQFLQNELTDSIKEFLSNINKKIQEIGSQNKKYLMGFDVLNVSLLPSECNDYIDCEEFRKYIKSDFAFRSDVEITRQDNKVKFALFGKEKLLQIKAKDTQSEPEAELELKPKNGEDVDLLNKSNESNTDKSSEPKDLIPAIINLNVGYVKLAIPTEQLDLKNYIASVYDSSGEIVNKSMLEIRCEGDLIVGGVLSSVTEKSEKSIDFNYVDPITGPVVKTLRFMFFENESKIIGNSKNSQLISLPSVESYTINYNYYVDKLIEQINELDLKKHMEVISCSLRAIFELSIDTIERSQKFNTFFSGSSSLEDKVVRVVKHIADKKEYRTAISDSTKIGYHSLNNILDSVRYISGMKTANLGAHKAGEYVSELDVTNLLKLAGPFVVVVNEMLQNNNIS